MTAIAQVSKPVRGGAVPGVLAQSKRSLLMSCLSREGGAPVDDLVATTGWLPHTLRAALTRLRQDGIKVERTKGGDGRTCYGIRSVTATPPPGRGVPSAAESLQPVAIVSSSHRPPRRAADERRAPLDWRAALERLRGAYSDNSIVAYTADMRTYEAWCREQGHVALPATRRVLTAYLAWSAAQHSAATVRRRVNGIKKLHQLLGFPNPFSDEEMALALRKIMRGKSRRHKQAAGLSHELRDRLIAACGEDLAGVRNRALVAVGYTTLCRRSELVALRIEDLVLTGDGTAQILVRRAKNDQLGEGRQAYVSSSALRHLQTWLRVSGLTEGWLFPATHLDELRPRALHPAGVSRVLKQLASDAGCSAEQIANLSGHSMRVGAAQDLLTAGADTLHIMQAGGWKSANMVARYTQHVNLTKLMARFEI